MLEAALIFAGLVAVAMALGAWSLCRAAGDADEAFEGGDMARFGEPSVTIVCEARPGVVRAVFTRAEWDEMSDDEREAAVWLAAVVQVGVAWRYEPAGREGVAK